MRFTPKNAGMDLSEIVEFLEDDAERLNVEFPFTEEQIPFTIAQRYVDGLYDLQDGNMCADVEAQIDARMELGAATIKDLQEYWK